MRKQVYEIDSNGFLVEIYVAEVTDGIILDSDKSSMISIDMPHGLIKPRLVNGEWVEGESEEEKAEREAQQLLDSLKPSPSEIADAELEIKIATMLTELGVTQ